MFLCGTRVFAELPGLKFLDGVAKQEEDMEAPPPDEQPSKCVVSWSPADFSVFSAASFYTFDTGLCQ